MRTPGEILRSASDRFVNWLNRIAEDGLITIFWTRIRGLSGHRRVAAKLIPTERTIDVHRRPRADRRPEVTHSAILYTVPALIALVGLVLLFYVPLDSILSLVLVLGVLGYAGYRYLEISRDRFVVTDSRVFRVWGVLTLNEAEMEIVRVLDITVERPWYLRPFSTGHIVLENAAQEQGLREIRFVPDPQIIATAIHRRRRQMMGLGGDDESGTPRQSPPRRGRRPNHPRSPGPVTARRH
jgi:Bacterial PH domain